MVIQSQSFSLSFFLMKYTCYFLSLSLGLVMMAGALGFGQPEANGPSALAKPESTSTTSLLARAAQIQARVQDQATPAQDASSPEQGQGQGQESEAESGADHTLNETLGETLDDNVDEAAAEDAPQEDLVDPFAGREVLEVTMTAYSSTVDQTDDSPFTTSTLQPVRSGIVAVSRDLLAEQLPYGTTLRVLEAHGEGEKCGAWQIPMLLEVQDTMHLRKRNQIDLWLPSRNEALQWGYCQATVEIIDVQATTRPANGWDAIQEKDVLSFAISVALLGQVASHPYASSHIPHMLDIFGMVLPSVAPDGR